MKDKIFFVGAGGIGMAALERFFLSQGYQVAGYDLTPSALTHKLEQEGVLMNYIGDVNSIPHAFLDPASTLVVYTPAVPANLECLQWFRNNNFEVIKRAKLLGLVTKETYGICFAGTHGKTTTSSIAAHILNLTPGTGCNAFLGGVLRNYGSNFILSPESNLSVIEADEFDRSFHNLKPAIAVITSADPDHLDIYGTEKEYIKSFEHFTTLIKPGGYLLMHSGLKVKPEVSDSVSTYSYSGIENVDADFQGFNIRNHSNHLLFDMKFPDGHIVNDLELSLPIKINVDNSVASIAAVWLAGKFNEAAVRNALISYKGVERRFELRWEESGGRNRIIIDDYAHHPAEIRASISSVKEMFPDRKLTVAFQPHLYTRTRDFAPQFAEALEQADQIIVVDLYPARELPIPGISSYTILDLIDSKKKHFVKKENFADFIKNINFEVLLTLGAGDLPNYIPSVIENLEKE